MKGVQIRTEYGDLRSKSSPNTEKYGPRKTPCLDTFHAPSVIKNLPYSTPKTLANVCSKPWVNSFQ